MQYTLSRICRWVSLCWYVYPFLPIWVRIIRWSTTGHPRIIVEGVPLWVRRRNLITSSTANLEWRHIHFICDLYSTFIRWVIGPSKNSMELFFNAKFDFKSTWNLDSTTSHHKHPVCQSPAGDMEKLTNVWSRYFGTNRIIDNWHRCLGVMWCKRKNYFHK